MALAARPSGPAWFTPFFRLVLRPIYLPLLLWIAGLLSAISLIELPDGSSALPRPGVDGTFDALAWVSLVRLAIVTTAATGFLGSMAVLDLLKGAFAWSLPSVRERLVLGQGVLGVIVSLPAPAYLAASGQGAMALAIAAIGLVAFGVGGSLPRVSSVLAFAVRLGILVGAWKAMPIAAPWIVQNPYLVAIAAVPALAAVYRMAYGATAARSHLDTWLWYGGDASIDGARQNRPSYTAWLRFDGRSWSRPLWKGTLVDWIRAGGYELFGGARFGRLDMFIVTLVLFSLPYFGLDSAPWMGTMMTVMMASFLVVPVIERGGPYPLSRARRASIIYWSAAWNLLLAVVIGFAWFAALAAFRLDAVALRQVFTWEAGALAATVAAMSPGFLWVSIRYDWRRSIQRGFSPRLMLAWLASMAFVLGGGEVAALFLVESGLFPSAFAKTLAVLGLAMLVQVTFWLALRRHLGRGDLK